jgi:hypothetical protein
MIASATGTDRPAHTTARRHKENSNSTTKKIGEKHTPASLSTSPHRSESHTKAPRRGVAASFPDIVTALQAPLKEP